MLKRMKSLFFANSPENYTPVEGVYAKGEIYAFQTKPFYDFGTGPTGRFGVVKFLGIKPNEPDSREENLQCFAVLDGVFDSIPTPDQVRRLSVLRRNRFMFNNRPSVTRIREETENTLIGFTFITHIDLTDDEKKVLSEVSSWSGLGAANTDVELEWRWKHDREQLISDSARDEAEQNRRAREFEEKRKKRLANLSYSTFVDGALFDHWRSDLSDLIVDHLEYQFSQTADSLQQLDAKPKRGDVRKILKGMVQELNDFNAANHGFIETLHREFLCDQISDLAHLAKQPKLIAEIEDWRDW